MAHILIMPRQGNTVESCIIVDWKVKEGDTVAADTVAAEVETDKATFEVPAGEAGTVLKLFHAAGDDVPVLEPIAAIGRAGEDWTAALGGAGTAAAASAATAPAAVSTTSSAAGTASGPAAGQASAASGAQVSAPGGRIFASPRARNLADKEGVSLSGISASGPDGRIIERDVAAALQGRPPLTAAARAAWSKAPGALPAAGSGLGGRITAGELAGSAASSAKITAEELAAVLRTAEGAVAAARAAGADLGEGRITESPVKGIRKLIADRMLQSLAESAQFTLQSSAPASRMQELRSRMKAADAGSLLGGLSKVTVNDLILFAVSRLLPRFPFMNALKTGDTLKSYERVHLGVAVDTPKGLMVPVIRNANLLSLAEISSEAKRLAGACQGGGIKPEELSGSTFTVTNLGSLGISGFTPVINAPEVAILGVCGIELKPVAAEDGCDVHFEPHIGFSLTINHQVVDGAPAARFLKALGEAVANIDLWLAV